MIDILLNSPNQMIFEQYQHFRYFNSRSWAVFKIRIFVIPNFPVNFSRNWMDSNGFEFIHSYESTSIIFLHMNFQIEMCAAGYALKIPNELDDFQGHIVSIEVR